MTSSWQDLLSNILKVWFNESSPQWDTFVSSVLKQKFVFLRWIFSKVVSQTTSFMYFFSKFYVDKRYMISSENLLFWGSMLLDNFCKDRGLFVRNKPIAYLWFLVQHVSALIKFVRSKRLQNWSSLSTSIPAVLISKLKSPIIMKLSQIKLALLRESLTSLKDVHIFLKLGDYRCPYKTISFRKW